MSLKQLYDIFSEQIKKENHIIISQSTYERNFFSIRNAFGASSIVVSDCKLSLFQTYIEVSGTTALPTVLRGQATKAVMRFEEKSSSVLFWEFSFFYPDKYLLKDFFAEPEKSRYNKNGLMVLDESILSNVSINSVVLKVDSKRARKRYPFTIEGNIHISDEGVWSTYSTLIDSAINFKGDAAIYRPFFVKPQPAYIFAIPLAAISGIGPFKGAGTKINLTLHVQNGEVDPYGYTQENIMSSATLVLDAKISNIETPIKLSLELFTYTSRLNLLSEFEDGIGIFDITNFFMKTLGTNSLLVPENSVLNTFKLYKLDMILGMGSGNMLFDDNTSTLEAMNIVLGTSQPIPLPISWMRVENVALIWQVSWGKDSYLYTAEISGMIRINLGDVSLKLSAHASLPGLDLEASLVFYEEPWGTPEKKVTLSSMLKEFNAPLLSTDEQQNKIASIYVAVSFERREFYIEAEINDILSFEIGSLKIALEKLYANAYITQSSKSLCLGGTIGFGKDKDYFSFSLEAQYQSNEKSSHWAFKGYLSHGKVNILNVFSNIFGIAVSEGSIIQNVLNIELSELNIAYETTGNFLFSAAAQWNLFILGTNISINAKIFIDKKVSNMYAYLSFGLRIALFDAVAQIENFYSDTPRYDFKIGYDNLYIKASYAKIKNEEILTLSMGGTTFGGIIEFFVNLINPNKHFRLSSPWNILNKIELSRFNLVINTTKKTVSFYYLVDMSIAGLMELNKIGITYREEGNVGRVYISITGRLLEKTFTDNQPLEWDAIDEKPPKGSAENEKIFELFYLGIGSHLSNSQLKNAVSIQDALIALKSQLKPPEDKSKLPEAVTYDENSNWVFGADFVINDMIRVGVVLCDPNIYGISLVVETKEESALSAFNGLSLELIYKKITDEVGMFKAVLRLPDKFRNLQLGFLNISIGLLSIEIYTNGDFLLDLGFPHGGDFSGSFSVQAGIYTGRAGIYFGVLSSVSTNKVPKVTNGAFSPVVAMGLGLSIGLGRSFDFGIVKGGLQLELFGIFEGVFAIFKHNDSSVKNEAMYYYAHARVGISGSLFLSVDLKIITIQASVNILAYADIVIESYKDMFVELYLSLKLSASIKILFIKINFSFEFKQKVSFCIKSNSGNPPWALQGYKEKSVIKNDAPLVMFKPDALAENPWRIILDVYPLISVESTEFVSGALKQKQGQYCAAFILTSDQVNMTALVDMMVSWVLKSWDGEQIYYDESFFPERASQITFEILNAFLNNNALFSARLSWTDQNVNDGFAFPMIPALNIVFKNIDRESIYDIDYWRYSLVDEEYSGRLSQYFSMLNADPTYKCDNDLTGERITVSQILFADYFQLIAREVIQRIAKLFVESEKDVCELPKNISDLEKVLRYNPLLKLNKGSISVSTYSHTVKSIGEATQTLEEIKKSFSIKDYSVLLQGCAEQTQLILECANLGEINYTFNNFNRLTLKEVAALFFVRFYEYGISDEHSYKIQKIIELNSELELYWECKSISERNVLLPIGEGATSSWSCLRGDTIYRLSKYCFINELMPNENKQWDDFLAEVLLTNEADENAVMDHVKITTASVCVDGDLTLDMLFRRVYPDRSTGAFDENSIFKSKILRLLSKINLIDVTISLEKEVTVSELMSDTEMSFESLAQVISNGNPIVASGQSYKSIDEEVLEKTFVRHSVINKETVAEIGSMSSRFLLQGMRIPSPYNMNDIVPLYQVSGQQLTLTDDKMDWLLTVRKGDPECSYVESIEQFETLTSDLIKVHKPPLNLEVSVKKITVLSDFTDVPKCYPVSQTIKYHKTNADNTESIHLFSDAMLEDLSSMNDMPIVKNNDGQLMECTFVTFIPFNVKLRGGDTQNYEVYGTDVRYRDLLYQIINNDYCEEVFIVHASSPFSDVPKGVVKVDYVKSESSFIKANLSVETHMTPIISSTSDMENDETEYSVTLETKNKDKFLRMMWECSVVGSGGYYLHLHTKEHSKIPMDIFDTDKPTEFFIVVVWKSEIKEIGLINSCITPDTSAFNDLVTIYQNDSSTKITVSQPSFPAGSVGFGIEAAVKDAKDLFSILGYRVSSNGGLYTQSNESAPVMPRKWSENEAWEYLLVVPIHRFAQGVTDIYSAIGKKAKVNFELRDVLGNCAGSSKFCAEVTPDYNDLLIGIHEWPCNDLWYVIEQIDDEPVLNITLSPSTATENHNIEFLKLAILQLSQADTSVQIQTSLSSTALWTLTEAELSLLRRYANELLLYVEGLSMSPNPVVLTRSLKSFNLRNDIFVLETTIKIIRLTHGTVLDARERKSVVMPFTHSDEETGHSLKHFVSELERALPTLKIAQGDGTKNILYGITFGEKGFVKHINIKPYDFNGMSAQYFAITPLNHSLITKEVDVVTFDQKTQKQLFSNIDLEVWAKNFLTDWETIIGMDFAVRASASCKKQWNSIISCKKKMAEIISLRLSSLRCKESKPIPIDRAQAALKDRCMLSLSDGYNTAMVAVYELSAQAENFCRFTAQTLHCPEHFDLQASKIIAENKADTYAVLIRSAQEDQTSNNLDFEISISELEYDIQSHEGYESSKWLRFINAIKEDKALNINLNFKSEVTVQAPKRICPLAPVLFNHECITTDDATKISQLLKWDYSLNCMGNIYEQDTLYFQIKMDRQALMKLNTPKTLFDVLAQYEVNKTHIWHGLNSADGDEFVQAFSAFSEIAYEATGLWKNSVLGSGVTTLGNDYVSYFFKANINIKEKTFRISPLYGSEIILKELGIDAPQLSITNITKDGEVYFNLSMTNIPLYHCQRIKPFLQIIRNENLLQDTEINPDFIYRTPVIELDFLEAFNVYDRELYLGESTVSDESSVLALTEMLFSSIHIQEKNRISYLGITVSYNYGILKNTPKPVVQLPVTWIPNISLNKEFKNQIAHNIYVWYKKEKPQLNMAYFQFDVTAYTDNGERVLMHFKKLKIGIKS